LGFDFREAVDPIAELIHGPKPKLPPLISPVKKASRVETRVSHQKGAQGALL
jgi:hypothetical protein